jgi:3-methyl-2-oxobutanoate hydroxymethyltransferase
MSSSSTKRVPSPLDIQQMKGKLPIVSLTAYTTPMARLVDPHCDFVLVGDSVGMVLHGFDSTLPVTLDMMILHSQAVARGLTQAMLVVDMPFGSYEETPQQAFASAAHVMRETGCAAVKLEGGLHMVETIRFLVDRGIPVMAHVGLTPQAFNTLGGYKVQGRNDDADRIMKDAKVTQEAGAFSIVLEKIPAILADKITAELSIPTIGIGASVGCDGQILVLDDMLGLFSSFKPKFVKRFAELGDQADAAIAEYASEVRARSFPGPGHSFDEQPPTKSKK